jgi:hypothetical protein
VLEDLHSSCQCSSRRERLQTFSLAVSIALGERLLTFSVAVSVALGERGCSVLEDLHSSCQCSSRRERLQCVGRQSLGTG